MHLAYAQLLAARRGGSAAGRAAEIAHHLDSAHEPAEAIPAFVSAAREAIRLYAFQQALGQMERALALNCSFTPTSPIRWASTGSLCWQSRPMQLPTVVSPSRR